MLLNNKTAVVYGAAGNIGSAVARTFAQEGARVFLGGRTLNKLERVASAITARGGLAEASQVDALDEQSIERHLNEVLKKTDGIDVTFNAINIRGDLQGTQLLDLPVQDFTLPVLTGVKAHFLTATAAARHMVKKRSGVILTLSTAAAGLSGRDRVYHRTGGFATACAAIEALSRSLAGELGPHGIRVVCLRSDAIPETWVAEYPEVKAYMEKGTILGRLPTLVEIANAAAFMASERASAITGTIVNLTCGSIMDSN